MPWTKSLPPDTRAVGTGDPPNDMDAVLEALAAMGTGNNVQNPVFAGGADPTGAADSTAAFTAALAAASAGGTVAVPAGTYKITGALTPVTKVRVIGAGRGATTLVSTASSIFNMGTGGITALFELGHVTLDCTGSDIFTGANLSKAYIHDCELIQRSSGNSIWGAVALSQMIECRFERNEEYIHGATRSVPAWNLTSATSAVINQNVWRDLVANNTDHDSTQFYYKIAYTGASANAGMRVNTFENIVFEVPTGGMIRLESCTGTVIDQCCAWDIAANTVGNSMISLVKNASAGTGTQSTVIRNYGRLGGTSLNGNFDIQCDANCVQTAITAPSLNAGGAVLSLDLGSSAQVTLTGLPASYSLTNAATATFADTNGGPGLPQASPVPDDLGFIGWTYDRGGGMPGGATTGFVLATGGTQYLAKVPVRTARSVAGVRVYLVTAGNTLTSGQCFIGVIDSTGVVIGASADQSGAWVGSAGAIDAALSGGPFTVQPPFVWVAAFFNGTTGPSFLRSAALTAAVANGKLTAALSRYGSQGTGRTTSFATVVPASISQRAEEWWAAIY